jgi:hypothetical protein
MSILRVIRKISAPITKNPATWVRMFAVVFFLHITFHAVFDGYRTIAWVATAVAAIWIPDLIIDAWKGRKDRSARRSPADVLLAQAINDARKDRR